MFDEDIRRAATLTACLLCVVYAVVYGICSWQAFHFSMEVASAVSRGASPVPPVEMPDLTTLEWMIAALFAPSGITKGLPQAGGLVARVARSAKKPEDVG